MMSFVVYAYSYVARSGGGSSGIRWQVTGGAVTITQ
jgi:hypothetical protein